MPVTLKGGPELRARLTSLQGTEGKIFVDWKREGVAKMRGTGPHRTGTGVSSVRGVYGGSHRAAIVGAFWLIFIDRGTKAHDIKPQSVSHYGRRWITSVQPGGPKTGYGNPKALSNGSTIFGRKVHKRRQARRPFATAAAREAFAQTVSADTIVQLWNRKSGRGRFSKVKAA